MEILFNMTIAGTITALIILIIKELLRDKLTPKWHCLIWAILAVRLLFPGLPESEFSLMNTIPTAQNITTVERMESGSSAVQNESKKNYIEGSIIRRVPVTGAEQTQAFSVSQNKADAVTAGWIAGIMILAGFLIGSYLIFYRKSRKLPVCTDPDFLELLEECKRDAGIFSNKITLRIGSNTPMLQGLLRPSILIPEGYSRNELQHILIHELCHYKHKDVLINMLCCIFLCIYWFNPVFWLSFFVIRRDLEILCDERAIEITGERKEYATVLLKTALRKNQFLFATTSMQNGEKEVSRRIRHIASFQKPKLWISAIMIGLVIVIGAVCLTDASWKDTVNLEAGGGYFFQVPKAWVGKFINEAEFFNEEGEVFGGVSMMTVELGNGEKPRLETLNVPTPNHSAILERKVVKEGSVQFIMINLDLDSETAAQIAERNAKGDNSPSKKINQNHIFFWPDKNLNFVYTIWANSSEVNEHELIKIAKTFTESPYPQGYQPETPFKEDWQTTADSLMKTYFQNYVDAELPMSSDISGYRIDKMEQTNGEGTPWSIIYPGAAVFEVDYTLDIAYPYYYSFPGGGFEIGEGNRTKIYEGALAVFRKDWKNDVKFLGFVWPQDIGELGDTNAILHTLQIRTLDARAKALLEYKTPYIGDNSKVGGIIYNLPLAEYSQGMELHTKAEPYGLTVNYDLTKAGRNVFDNSQAKAPTDSSGWDPIPELKSQLFQNCAALFSLIDNCSYIELKVTGISEYGAPYTYCYTMDRSTFDEMFSVKPDQVRKNAKKYSEFLISAEQISFAQLQSGKQ